MDRQTLLALLATLNSVTVQGEDNLNKLLACIQTVRKALAAADNAQKEGHNAHHDNV
jgi:hypothetical protein